MRLKRSKMKDLVIMMAMAIALLATAAQAGQRFENLNDIQNPEFVFGEGQKKISDINVLLPLRTCTDCRRVYHLIKAYNGCYAWKVSHPQIIQLDALQSQTHPECSNIAEISNIQPKDTKNVVWLSARDQRSHSVLKAEVKVARLHRLEIHSRFRQINTGDKYHLEVRAHDDEGNTFSTLEGFKFDWTIESGHDNIMRITPQAAGHTKEHFSHRHHDESSQVNDDDFFLRALQSGFAEISVRILEPGYEHIKAAKIKLSIVDPFVILPTDENEKSVEVIDTPHILPTSEFSFKLAKVSMDGENGVEFGDIQIPSKKYEWNIVANKALGQIGEDGVFLSKAKPGSVDIQVVDTSFRNNTAEAEIKIVEPFSLQLELADVTSRLERLGSLENRKDRVSNFQRQLNVTQWASQWILVEGRSYLIKAFLFDKDHNLIRLNKNVVFTRLLDEKYLQLVDANLIGSELIVKVAKHQHARDLAIAHKTVFKAALKEIKTTRAEKYKVDSNRLREEKELTITGPVQIVHPTSSILLPFVQTRDGAIPGEMWTLQARGGSGSFVWSSADPSIARIGERSRVWSVNVGQTVVIARDLHNPENQASIVVEVQPVHHLLWLEPRVEAERATETTLLSAIAVDARGRKYTNCTALEFTFEIKGESSAKDEPVAGTWDNLQAYVKGEANQGLIRLRHRFDEQPSTVFETELAQARPLNATQLEILQHNNFGICDQVKVRAKETGVSLVKAFYPDFDRVVESEKAEVAAYQPLGTVKPIYPAFFVDLYSRSQSGQEFQTFDGFYPHGEGHGPAHDFVLSFGAGLSWELVGGGDFWTEFADDYITTWDINPDQETKETIVEVRHVSQAATKASLEVRCSSPSDARDLTKPFSYSVTVKQQGLVSRQLLRPPAHSETIRVRCEPPSAQRLLWSQQPHFKPHNTTFLPRSRFENNTRTHYALVSTHHSLRLLMLDKSGFASLNHSSISTSISSSDPRLATISDGQDYERRLLQVGNQTGTVFLNSVSTGYLAPMLEPAVTKKQGGYFGGASRSSGAWSKVSSNLMVGHAVTDQLRLEIVENVDIEPKFKSLYFQGAQNPFVFEILHGSGYFAVSLNDSAIAEVHHVGREVKIVPKREGSLRIRVEDVELPESQAAFSELLISDVAQLHLDSQGYLIEQGSSLNMTVTAFDNFGVEFDPDQYERMTFALEIEMTGIHRTRGLLAKHAPDDQRVFQVTGVEPGNYVVTAYIDRMRTAGREYTTASRITSDANKIEVFPVLELHPSTLLLTPHMRYTLSVLGGPSRGSYGKSIEGSLVDIRFDIEDREVATIDSFREVSAHKVGDTQLFYTIVQTKVSRDGKELRNTVSRRTVPIRVRLVTAIEIPYNQQRIVYSGSMLKQIAVLKHQDEYFSHGIAPISWDWNCSHANILKPYLPAEQEALPGSSGSSSAHNHVQTKLLRNNLDNNNAVAFTTSFNSSSIYSSALKSGEAMLRVRMVIEYPELYKHEKNWFKTEALLKVQDKLTISVPEFIPDADKQTHLYLLPPGALSRISTNRNTRMKLGYSMQSVYDYTTQQYEYQESTTPIISLVNDEAIQTHDKYGKVTVIVEENQAFSDQVVMLNVLITDIYSLAAQNFYEALSLPLGSSVNIPIKFYNEHAHLFANGIEGVQVGIELSHPRVVSAELDRYNSTLTLQSEGSGECNVVLYLLSNPSIFDVFRVRVATIVQPSSPVYLHVGSETSFKIVANALDQMSRAGMTWSSSNPKVLEISSQDGTAVARSEGRADIMLSNNINAASIAHVSKVKHAEIEHQGPQDLLLNVDDLSDQLRIRLRLHLHNQVEELMPVTQFEGMTLIRQNVGLKCETDHPEHLEATAEISEMEGYFCNIRYIGTSRDAYRRAPRRAKVSVTASGHAPRAGPAAGKKAVLYEEEVVNFEITLAGSIEVEPRFRSGINLGLHSRTKSIGLLSLSEFKVKPGVDSKKLKVRASREALDTNHHNLTVTVPSSVLERFATSITLENLATGEETRIPVVFDPRDLTGKAAQPARASSRDQGWETGSGSGSTAGGSSSTGGSRHDSAAGGRGPTGQQQGAPAASSASWLTLLFLLVMGVMAVSHLFGVPAGLLSPCERCLRSGSGGRGGRGRTHQDRSNSHYQSALGPGGDSSYRSRASDGYGGASNYHGRVRPGLGTSPDAKLRDAGAGDLGARARFGGARGSVASPGSMARYRRVDAGGSIHQNESHY